MNTEYYVYSADNNHVGPVSAELIARGVLAGKIASGTFVAPLGSGSWLPYEAVGEVAEAIAVRSSLPPPSADMPIVVLPPPPAALDVPEIPEGVASRSWLLPLAVFGGFAVVGALETVIALALRR